MRIWSINSPTSSIQQLTISSSSHLLSSKMKEKCKNTINCRGSLLAGELSQRADRQSKGSFQHRQLDYPRSHAEIQEIQSNNQYCHQQDDQLQQKHTVPNRYLKKLKMQQFCDQMKYHKFPNQKLLHVSIKDQSVLIKKFQATVLYRSSRLILLIPLNLRSFQQMPDQNQILVIQLRRMFKAIIFHYDLLCI